MATFLATRKILYIFAPRKPKNKNMANKNLKVGQIYFISEKRGENPKLGAKLLSDGRESLFLEYYFGYKMVYSNEADQMQPKKKRRRENLKIFLWHKPRTPEQRTDNKEAMALAEAIRRKKADEMEEPDGQIRLRAKKHDENFFDYFQQYIDKYTKADIRVIQMAFNRFKSFLSETPEYKMFENGIKANQIDCEMIEAFTEYLQATSRGYGAKSIYQRFKKVIRAAVANDVMVKNPCINKQGQPISIMVDEGAIVKDVLSPDEIRRLVATHYDGENTATRNAFLFSLNTGMRWCDVKDLTFGDFDFSNRIFSYNQNKTKGHSAKSVVTLPLTDALLGLMGDEPEKRSKSDLVFALPSHTMALKMLRKWVQLAEIDKHVTFHCARHSFGTNMAATAARQGLSIRVVQEMMGHSNLRYTEMYTRVLDDQKQAAMAELSKIMEG